MTGKHYVYALFRPDNASVFYIGMGHGSRAWQHCKARRRGRSHKDNVICRLVDDLGFREIPVVIIRDGLSREQAADLEIALIYAIGRHPNGPLTNIVRGGEGLADPTPEFRAAHGKRMREALADPSIRQKMSDKAKARDRGGEDEARRRARMSEPDVRERLRQAGINRERSPEFEAHRISRSLTPEAREKRRLSMAGRMWITDGVHSRLVLQGGELPVGWWHGRAPAAPETRANMAAAHLGRKLPEEQRQKIGTALRGQRRPGMDRSWFRSAEGRAHLSAASKARWARARANQEH